MKYTALLAIAMAMVLTGCIGQAEPAKPDAGRLNVVVSFYPIYDFAKNVGGDKVGITALIPTGVEPHDFEPSPGTMKAIGAADIFIYNGAGMEQWVDRVVAASDNKGLAVVDSSKGITLIAATAGHSHHEGEAEHHEHTHDEMGYDPHIWLDPVNAKKQVSNIRDAFIKADPANADYYSKNAAAYIARLDALDSDIRATMGKCRKKEIIITHATLGYFCARYGCVQIPITGVQHEAEPSPADIAEIIDEAKENNASMVFFESLVSPKTAELIAGEIGGGVAVFNSIHGLTDEERKAGKDYVSLMEENIKSISVALECGG